MIVVTIGSIGGLFFWIFYACGLVRVKGYWKLLAAVRRGRVLIAARHPTLLETFIIPFMFWPFVITNPKKLFVWSMPAKELFSERISRILFSYAHCIPVDRSGGSNREAIETMRSVLRSGATVVVHPEQGRTRSESRSSQKPTKRYGRNADRYIRRIVSQIPNISRETGAQVVPVYIDVPFMNQADGWNAFWVWLKGWHTITFHVGDAFTFPDRVLMPRKLRLHLDNKELGRRILSA